MMSNKYHGLTMKYTSVKTNMKYTFDCNSIWRHNIDNIFLKLIELKNKFIYSTFLVKRLVTTPPLVLCRVVQVCYYGLHHVREMTRGTIISGKQRVVGVDSVIVLKTTTTMKVHNLYRLSTKDQAYRSPLQQDQNDVVGSQRWRGEDSRSSEMIPCVMNPAL